MRNISTRLAILIAAGWLVLPCPGRAQGSKAETTQASGGNAKNGEKLYNADGCYQCHNYQGQGGGAGPRLAPNPLPFAALNAYVRQPKNQMPPYTTKVLSDPDMKDIYAYLQSIPKASAAKSIPLLNER